MKTPEARPEIPSVQKGIGTKDIEVFQNNILRPIIKQLHNLLVAHFSNLLFTKKGQYFKIADDQKEHYIHNIFQKELRYKAELKGIIIGNFTLEEFENYQLIDNQIDKRIFSIVEERILTNQNDLKNLRA